MHIRRSRPDLIRIALLTSLGVSGCAAAAGDGDPNAAGTAGTTGITVTTTLTGRCYNARPVLVDGVDTGMVQCENGVMHRPAVVSCEAHPRTEPLAPPFEGAPPCSDSDCSEHPYGFCDYSFDGPQSCAYGCLQDSDCEAGSVCVCGTPYGTCEPADCTTDAECGEGSLCARVNASEPVCGTYTKLACQTPGDTCNVDEDCGADPNPPNFPNYCSIETGVRECHAPSGVVCGRPFLVAGAARQAEVTNVAGWRLDHELQAAVPLDQQLAARLAEHWNELALMEHASIAAFARFALQLLQVGAPAELITETQRAMMDETQHARMCFELASRYAGTAMGPTPLAMHGALDSTSLRDIVLLTVLEGCVGETAAALEAAEAAAYAVDPVVRAVLQQIQQDELRHAQLAWQFVTWALQQDTSGELKRDVAELFATLQHEVPLTACAPQRNPSDDTLLTHGVIQPALREQIRQWALRDVVLPCAERLLEDPSPRVAESLATVSA